MKPNQSENPEAKLAAENPKKTNAAPKKSRNTRTANTTLVVNDPSRQRRLASVQEPPKPSKKKTRRLHQSPAATLPEDEALNEALEEMLPEEEPFEVVSEDAPDPSEARPRNLYSRIKERRETKEEQKLSTTERIYKKSGLSEDDVAMVLSLGYESELGRLIGYDNLKKLKIEHLQRVSRSDTKHYRTAFGYCGEEYLGEQNKQRIIAAYLHDRRYLILRTLLTALAAVALFFLDLPFLFGDFFQPVEKALPLLLPILSFLILIGASALSIRQLDAGIRSYFNLAPTPYSVPAILLPFTLVYNVLMLVMQASGISVNFLMCFLLLLLALCDVGRLASEMSVFALFSAEGTKTVLESVTPRKKKLRQGKVLVKIINDDIDESFYRVRRAQEVTGFFRRFNSMSSANRPFQYLIGVMLGLSFVLSFFCAVQTQSFSAALSSFMILLFLTHPACAVLAFFLPMHHANRILLHHNCALLGEEAMSEYARSKTVIFRDVDLCIAERCTRVSVRESEELRRDLNLAAILFRKIAGTLENVAQTPTSKLHDPPTSLIRISDNGLEGVIDNQYHIIAGNDEFLQKCGIAIPTETSDKSLRRTPNTSLMYIAVDGVLKLSYEVEYKLNASFERIAAELADLNTAIAVQSCDPNINENFFNRIRSEDAPPIRVIKPGRYESDSILELTDTGALALGARTDIVYPLHAARQIKKTMRFTWTLQFCLTALISVGVSVLSFFDLFRYIDPLTVLLIQLFSILVVLIATGINLNRRTLHIRKRKQKS